MRRPLFSIPLIVLLALLLAPASALAAAPPSIVAVSDGQGPDSISFEGTLDPGGLVSEYWVDFFPATNTPNCVESRDPGDEAQTLSTPHQSVSTDLGSTHPVSVEIDGLPHEGGWCWVWRASNAAGEFTGDWRAAYTESIPPEVTGLTFSGGDTSIGFSLVLTPNTNAANDPVYIATEHMVKDAATCAESTAEPVENNWLGVDSNGWLGFVPIPLAHAIGGVSANTTYCVRIRAVGRWGDSAGAVWSEVTTDPPQTATIEQPLLLRAEVEDPATSAQLKVAVDDQGAADAVGSPSTLKIGLWAVALEQCNATQFSGGTEVFHVEQPITGATLSTPEATGLIRGGSYCIVVEVDSAWGAGSSAARHTPVVFGGAPLVTLGSPQGTSSSVTLPGSALDPGSAESDWAVHFFALPAGISCAEAPESSYRFGDSGQVTTNLAELHALTPVVAGLEPATTYCLRLTASNSWGSAASGWITATTSAAPAPPPLPEPVPAPPPESWPGVKMCFKSYTKKLSGRLPASGRKKLRKKYSLKITGKPTAGGAKIVLTLKSSRIKPVVLLGKKKLKGKKVTLTTRDGVKVTYKLGRRTKTVKLALRQNPC